MTTQLPSTRAYRERRLAEAAVGRLRVVLHHADLLAGVNRTASLQPRPPRLSRRPHRRHGVRALALVASLPGEVVPLCRGPASRLPGDGR
jgi:hypothetical protein